MQRIPKDLGKLEYAIRHIDTELIDLYLFLQPILGSCLNWYLSVLRELYDFWSSKRITLKDTMIIRKFNVLVVPIY